MKVISRVFLVLGFTAQAVFGSIALPDWPLLPFGGESPELAAPESFFAVTNATGATLNWISKGPFTVVARAEYDRRNEGWGGYVPLVVLPSNDTTYRDIENRPEFPEPLKIRNLVLKTNSELLDFLTPTGGICWVAYTSDLVHWFDIPSFFMSTTGSNLLQRTGSLADFRFYNCGLRSQITDYHYFIFTADFGTNNVINFLNHTFIDPIGFSNLPTFKYSSPTYLTNWHE